MTTISDLPDNIIQIILVLLPTRDMVRTGILSRSWRSQWKKVPQLVFDNKTLPSLLSYEDKCRYNMQKVFGVLLLHHGPILKFALDTTSCFGIDHIISFLSRNGIQDLTLQTNGCGLLPSSILSCVELKHLSLRSFGFRPNNFTGLNKLVSLELLEIEWGGNMAISSCPLLESLKLHNYYYFDCFSVDAPNLKILIFKGCFRRISYMNTPNLRVLSLTGEEDYLWNKSKFDLLELIRSLPLLENLHLYCQYLKFLAMGDSPSELPTVLNNLQTLELIDINEFPTALWLIKRSPNLRKLNIKLLWRGVYFEQEAYTHSCPLKLQEVEIVLQNGWSYLRHWKEFLKFALRISPELKTLQVKSGMGYIDDAGYKALVELGSYPRASAKARIIYVGLEL